MNILVLGEICEDIFIYGECERLNPEAPTPVFVPNNEVRNYGMAGNTIENLKYLGCNVLSLEECGKNNLTKKRFVDSTSNYILLRVDENEKDIEPITMDRLKNVSFKNLDAVVISDYNKGLLTEKALKYIFNECSDLEVPTFMDTKKNINMWAYDCDFIKINEKEYNGEHKLILNKFFKDKLIVTLGSKGARYKGEMYPTEKVEVRDVVGAGDTFLSALVYGYLKNKDIEEAIKIANVAASDVVCKKGVALPNKDLL